MKGFLNNSQINYVLFHLGHHVVLNDRIREAIYFAVPGEDFSQATNKIIFPLTDTPANPESVRMVYNIPVLFPLNAERTFYDITDSNVIFTCDLLKSSFYLLSGYQERADDEKDFLGRYPVECSIQHKLGFLSKPVVNYYFKEIIAGIREFCTIHSIEFTERVHFKNFAFFLTHDVDRIKYFTLNTLLYKIKEATGLVRTNKVKKQLISDILYISAHLFSREKDPYWNFREITGFEKRLGIKSTWYFLPKDQKHKDSYYSLDQKEIRELIAFLLREGNEAGLHGTVRSHTSESALKDIINELKNVSGLNKTGIRQHRLLWKHPVTALIHEKAGIVYDSTLGFAGHEGFRNSYCHPFKLYDFEKDRIIDTWEIPLNLMDGTVLDYRKLEFSAIMKSVQDILEEVIRFNGVFTLLCHNHLLFDRERPGFTDFYNELLKTIMSESPESLRGIDIIEKMK